MNSGVFSPIATVSQRPVHAVCLSKHFERMVCSKELAEFECGAIIGFHHCNEPVSSSSSRNQVSSLLDILQLSVNYIFQFGNHSNCQVSEHRKLQSEVIEFNIANFCYYTFVVSTVIAITRCYENVICV